MQQINHIIAAHALVPQFYRRNTQPFGVDFFGIGIVACGHRAADVGNVAFAHRPKHQLAVVEHRLIHAAIENMAALVDGVVVVNHIAFVDVVAKIFGHCFHGGHQRAQVNRNVLALQNHFRQVVEQGIAVIVCQIEYAGAGGFFQRERHLALGGFQRTTHHG